MNVKMDISQTQPGAQLNASDFDAIAAIALREFGLSLPVSKKQLVQSRLSRRLRKLRLSDFHSYRLVLEKEDNLQERIELLSALTTNVTSFFREIHHFEDLIGTILPKLCARARAGQRVRIWSAACSSGQEPYSIAMSALKCDPGIGQYDFKILGTDIDGQIVEKAQAGIYQTDEIKDVSTRYYRKCDLVHEPKGAPGTFSISSDVHALVTFGVLNLVNDLPFSGAFDVIFCRNVAIYFNRETQYGVWQRLSNLLPAGGLLFIGHSERISKADRPDLEPAGITTYRKC